MPKCCSCGSSGTCKACTCARGRRRCIDCIPSRHSRCVNVALPGDTSKLVVQRNLSSQSALSLRRLPPRASPSSLSSSSFSSSLSSSLSSTGASSHVLRERPGAGGKATKITCDSAPVVSGLTPQPQLSASLVKSSVEDSSVRQRKQVQCNTPQVFGEVNDDQVGVREPKNDIKVQAHDDHVHVGALESDDISAGVADNGTASDCCTLGQSTVQAVDIPSLPQYKPVAIPNFRWAECEGEVFVDVIRTAYYEVSKWRRNVFLVPSGRAGKEFVRELARLINAYAQSTALESVALQAAMTACVLLLQKPHVGSKARDHEAALERRLRAWQEADIEGLLREGRAIQNHLRTGPRVNREDAVARIFARLVMEGKINAAMRYLSDNQDVGLLSLDEMTGSGEETVRDALRAKHPAPREVRPEALISSSTLEGRQDTHPVVFGNITGDSIRAAAIQAKGSAGPSGVDAAGWRRLLSSFHKESKELCSAVAALARRLCSAYVHPEGLVAYLACRLIPLNKNSGVRPIGVGEVLRRIIGKAVMKVVSADVLQATGPLQLCAGHQAGCEAAVHAMKSIFQEDETEALIFVDATNAFNNLNRRVALLNVHFTCPAIATILTNCYRSDSLLFVQGEILQSREGTTQGDSLAMAMFALASVPLIKKIETEEARQAWFADDASAGGLVRAIRQWWDRLTTFGPMYGYFANGAKTSLLVKEEHAEEAKTAFEHTDVKITTIGKRYLGGAIGNDSFIEEYIEEKVIEWVGQVERLSTFAKSQPHASFAAFTHGLVHKWVYLCRVLEISEHQLQPLENAIQQSFLPALTGRTPPNSEVRNLLALPPRYGGLGIVNPTTVPQAQYSASITISRPLVDQIRNQNGDAHVARFLQLEAKKMCNGQRRNQQEATATSVIAQLPSEMQRNVKIYGEKGTSAWLTALPLERHGFVLHKADFRDALCLRYGWPLAYSPSTCSCGANYDPDHMLICRYGGYLSLRHNEIRDLTANLLKETCVNVTTEPCLQPITGEALPRSGNQDDEARVDIKAKGFWSQGSQEAFFDVRVFHPFAPSYLNTSIAALYKQHENKKKREYGQRIRDIERGCFTPLVFTTTGGMGKEATAFYKRLASLLSEVRKEPYSAVMSWVRCRISFALLRSAILCIRGSRSRKSETDIPSISLAHAESRL